MQNNQHVKHRIAVLMTCYNRKKTTSRCLSDLASLDPDPALLVDIYLVDDGSTDGTGQSIKENYPYVNVIEGDGNLFWNRGTHLAFSKAISSGSYDFYLWLNDDTHLYPSALQTLIKTYEKLRDTGYSDAIVAGATQDQDTKAFTYGGVIRHKTWYGWRFERVWSHGGKVVECDATNGNCVLIPRAVVEKVGNLDTRFQHRWGDHDYCFRAKDKGCTIWLASDFIGTCSRNPIKGTWKDDQLPMMKRIRLLWAPSGLLPSDYWVYLKRHRGGLWFLFWLAPFVKIFLSATKNRFSSHSSEPDVSAATGKSIKSKSTKGLLVSKKPIFIIWKVYQRRAESLADKLGLDIIYYHLPWEERSKTHKLVSYFFKLIRTATDLARYRPNFLFVQLPPIPLLYLIALYSRFSGCRVVADCHNAMIDGPWIKFPFAIASLKQAQYVLVHNPDIADMARKYGLDVTVSRDQLPHVPQIADEQVLEKFHLEKGQYVIVPWNFAADEPIREFAECARALPDIQFVATWFKERLDSELLKAMPENVLFSGFLEVDIFNQLFHHAGAALSLTVREGTQPSAASEAIAFGVPVVVSDLQTTRRLYGDKVVFVRNEPQSIAKGLTQALSDPVWREKTKELRLEFDAQLQKEIDNLRAVIQNINP